MVLCNTDRYVVRRNGLDRGAATAPDCTVTRGPATVDELAADALRSSGMGIRGPAPVSRRLMRALEQEIIAALVAIVIGPRPDLLPRLWRARRRRDVWLFLKMWRRVDASADAERVRGYIESAMDDAIIVPTMARWPKRLILEHSRIVMFARALAGALLGLSPATSVRILRERSGPNDADGVRVAPFDESKYNRPDDGRRDQDREQPDAGHGR